MERKSNRTLLIVILVLIGIMSVGIVGAFARADRNKAVEENENELPELTVTFFFDENTPGTHYRDLWEELGEKYGYQINVESCSTQQIKNKLRVDLACDELPDIFAVWGGSYPDYLFDAGACLSVQDTLEASGMQYKDMYVQKYSDGNNYIIPCLVEAYAVTYCNQNLMDEMGLTMPANYDELKEFVRDVQSYNEENGTDYVPIELGDKDEWLGELLYDVIVNENEPDACTQILDGTASLSTDKVCREAAEKIEELREMGAFPSDAMGIAEVEAIENFIDGEAVLFPHQSTITNYLVEQMGEDAFSVELFPGNDSGEPIDTPLTTVNHTLTPGLCISSTTEYPEDAKKICMEFAELVNEKNVTEYGYLNLEQDDTLDLPDPLAEPLKQLHDLVDPAADTQTSPCWSALLDQTGVDDWQSLTKNLFAGAISVDDFLQQGDEILSEK